jgi:uncharacterized protein YlxW (UPF0749 family)
MRKTSIKELVEELDREIERARSLNAQERELLEDLRGDIRMALERSRKQASVEGTVEKLREAAGRFEVSHPSLTAALAQVMDSLVKMGV